VQRASSLEHQTGPHPFASSERCRGNPCRASADDGQLELGHRSSRAFVD
jgi:hypothetical protein